MPGSPPPRSAFAALRAFRSRNYRLYFGGQLVSLTGTWMQRVALGWLVYRLTRSGWWLGMTEMASNFTSALLAPVAGVIADRCDRKRILVATQVAALVQSALLAWLVLAGEATVGRILALSLFAGLINGFEFPTRHSFAVDLAERREDLPSVIALNSFMFNIARLVGPGVAGAAIAAWGEGPCFLINSLSFVPVIASLLLMTTRPRPPRADAVRLLAELAEGARYAWRSRPIRSIILLLTVFSFFGMPYVALMPMLVAETFRGDARTLGHLMSAAGLGAVGGAAYVAARRRVSGLEVRIPLASIAFGISLAGFAYARDPGLALGLMLVIGFESLPVWVASNTLLQTIVDDAKRGRVMSFFIMTFLGAAPLGSLFLGWLAGRWGVSPVIAAGGLLCACSGLWFLRGVPAFRAAAGAQLARADAVAAGA